MPMQARNRMRALSAAATLAVAAAAFAAPGEFANVPLITQDGQVVHFYDDLLKGKAVVINLIYTHCTASCPLAFLSGPLNEYCPLTVDDVAYTTSLSVW